jgi:hypothetical protein
MHRQGMDRSGIAPSRKNSDFAALRVRAGTFGCETKDPVLALFFACVTGLTKIFQHAATSRKT